MSGIYVMRIEGIVGAARAASPGDGVGKICTAMEAVEERERVEVNPVSERNGELVLVAGTWGETSRERCAPWFVGRYGWVLDQRRVFGRPVPCRGFQKLWTVPDEIAARVGA